MKEKIKAGLEIHQQLDCGKLFCRCPSILREDKPDFVVRRKLRAVASELGEFDPASLQEYKKNYAFAYEAYKNTNCLIELDEEPPKSMNLEALKTALKISLMAEAEILDEAIVMRKAVIDGSNTSGFQRTALIAGNGKIKVNGKQIGIQTIVLEEDAARPTKKEGKEIHYRLDRLGIPLIEIATAPEIESAEELQKVALEIGKILRLTGKAKRGLGTIRQDLNISIEDGARIELKGIQELEKIAEFARREVQRQKKLIEIAEDLKKKVSEKELEKKFTDVSEIFANTECKFLKIKKVFAVKLKGFNGLIGREVQPEKRLGTEFADYVKAKTGVKGILHSDELPAYGVSEEEKKKVLQEIEAGESDAFVLVAGEEAQKALEYVVERATQALKGVPEETRNALENGNSEYLRPLPGAARMYPETDLETIEISDKMIAEAKKELPLSLQEREKLYQKLGLSKQLTDRMKLSNYALLFEKLSEKFNATQTASLLLEGLTQLKREGARVEKISEKMIEEALSAVSRKKISREVLLEVLKEWSEKTEKTLDEIVKERIGKRIDEKELNQAAEEIVVKNLKLVEEKGERALSALMGEVMKKFKGKVSGEKAAKALKEKIKKHL